MLNKVIREPLVHFLSIGLFLFLLFNIVNPSEETVDNVSGSTVSSKESSFDPNIVVNDATIAYLKESYKSLWQREPTPLELQGILSDYIRKEILYRVAISMRLEENDPVIKRRVIQKLDLLTEESAIESPTDEMLKAYLNSHMLRYQEPTLISFEQLIFEPTQHADLEADFNVILAKLQSGALLDKKMGDNSLLPNVIKENTQEELEKAYGVDFVSDLLAEPLNQWGGPLVSGYGAHLIRLTALKTPTEPASFEKIKGVVLRDWEYAQREKAKLSFYQKVKPQFNIDFQLEQFKSDLSEFLAIKEP